MTPRVVERRRAHNLQFNRPEEAPVMSNTVKRRTAQSGIWVGTVITIVAVAVASNELLTLAGKKWM